MTECKKDGSGRDTALGATIKFVGLQAVYWSGYCAVSCFAAIYLLEKGFRDGQIGMILAASSVGAVLFQTLLASASDRSEKGGLRFMTGALALGISALAAVLLAVGDSRAVIGLLFFLILLLMMSMQTPMNGLIMEYRSSGVAVDFGTARAAGSVAYGIMSFLLGQLVAARGAGMLPWAYILMFCLTAAFMLLLQNRKHLIPVIPVSLERGVPQQPDSSQRAGGALLFLKHHRKFCVLLAGTAMIFTCHSMFSSYMIRIVEALEGGSAEAGTAISVASVLELPTMAAFTWMVARVPCGRLLGAAGLLFSGKALALCLAATMGAVYGAQALQMLSYAIFIPASVYYVDRIMAPGDKMKGQSLMVAAITMGNVFGSLLGGFLLDLSGISAMLWAGVLISAGGSIVVLCAIEHKRM